MSDTVVQLVNRDEVERRKEDADTIRDFADAVERGEITELVIVANNRNEYCFERFGTFRDRWHLLGAIEHAKSAVIFD